jgi:hypothetical protein
MVACGALEVVQRSPAAADCDLLSELPWRAGLPITGEVRDEIEFWDDDTRRRATVNTQR